MPPEDVTHDELRTLLRLAHFLDTTKIGFAYFDAQGFLRDCNQTVADLVDTTIDGLVGQPFDNDAWRTVHDDGTPFVFLDLYDVTDPDASARVDIIIGLDFELAARRWFSVDTYPLSDEGVIVTIADVTDTVTRGRLLEIVSEVNRFAMTTTDEHEALQHLCEVLVAPGRHALAWVGVARADRDDIAVMASAGATAYLEGLTFSTSPGQPTSSGPASTALRTGEPQVIHDVDNVEIFGPWRQRAREFRFESVAVFPFAPDGERAVLAVYDYHVFAFSEQVRNKLQSVVEEVEFAIAHVRSVAQLAASLDGTLSVLSRITETRDPYTAGHQNRVGMLAEEIARTMGVEESLVRLIRQAGEVHDVGKTAIPTEILTRPGKLSALDFELVTTHCQVGADILAHATLPWPLAEVAHSHHERMDGSGYPRGLKGREIILPARIIAVADVVEAMVHHRPYRAGLGLDAALEEIRTGAGRLFDPDVVAACLAVFDAGFRFPEF